MSKTYIAIILDKNVITSNRNMIAILLLKKL